jgi:hypothetical protein
MRRTMILIALCALAVASAAGQGKKTVLVAPLSSNALAAEERRLVTDAVIARIMGSAAYAVASEESRQLALREIEQSQSGLFGESQALAAGKLVEADYVLEMEANSLAELRAYATARLIEVASGKAIMSASQEFLSMDRIAERMRSLVSKAMGIEGAQEASLPTTDEMVYITPSQYKVFQGISLGGLYYSDQGESRTTRSASAAIGMYQVYGRPLGLMLDASFIVPAWMAIDGDKQEWLFKLGFPWGVNLYLGANYLWNLGDSAMLGLAGGFHTAEFLFYPPGGGGSAEAQSYFGGKIIDGYYWNYGPFVGLSAFAKVGKSSYLIAGAEVALDLAEVLPTTVMEGYTLKSALSVAPFLGFAVGK